jgi:DNA-binding transcriptional LysR family regulator
MLFPPLLSAMAAHADLSGITVECGEADVAQAEFPALTAEYDIVIAHRPDRGRDWPRPVSAHPLLREPLDVVVPLGHRLASRRSVTPLDLAGEAWIAVRPGFPLADVVEAIIARSGQPAPIAHRINDFGVIEAMVAAGHGISLLPRYSLSPPGWREFALLPLAGLRAGRRIEALARPDRVERLVVRRVLTELRRTARAVLATG